MASIIPLYYLYELANNSKKHYAISFKLFFDKLYKCTNIPSGCQKNATQRLKTGDGNT